MKILKRKTLAALLALSLLASLLPLGAQPAQAADGSTVYVGGVALTGSEENPAYATTDDSGNVIKEGATVDDYNIKWDGSTLILRGATIKKELNDYDESLFYITGAAIGVFNQSGDANLTITLEGTNTIEGVSYGIRVYAPSIGSANLTITGSGTLVVNSNQDPIYVISSNDNAALGIKNAKVTATSSFGFGVTVQSGSSEISSASLTVDGGSLTATADSRNVSGIRLRLGTSGTSDDTPTVTVSNNAIVRANGSAGGITSNSSTGVQYGTGSSTTGGIVFDGKNGTVYGNVTLQENITIGEGESLTLDNGASLNAGGHNVIVDGGTLDEDLVEDLGDSVIYKVTSVSLDKDSLNLTDGGSETLTATITPNNATNQNVTWESSNPSVATVDESGKVTAIAPGEATITVTTADGGKTATCTVTVHTATTITTQPQSVSVTEGQSATFSVTATGDNLRYQWQINSGNGWSAITDATDASYTIDRTTTAMSGNQYRCIVIGDGGETTSSAATLTVRPYEPPYTGKYSYEIVSDVGENGTIDVDRYATEGDQVTITVSPDEAYLLDDLTVTSGGKDVALTDNGDGTYTFTMPSADVRITATFAEDPDWTEPEEPATDVSDIFIDVAPNAWYKDAVQYAYDNGLMTGVSANEFAPEQTTTRAMIVSMLARLEGVESANNAGFADVSNEWYATAVNWAANVGVVNGYEDSTFRPNTAITREQLAAILMNYAQYKGQDVSARADLNGYTDQPSTWAQEAISWSVAEGLLTGVTADTLQPQGAATRAQVAAILQRFLSE